MGVVTIYVRFILLSELINALFLIEGARALLLLLLLDIEQSALANFPIRDVRDAKYVIELLLYLKVSLLTRFNFCVYYYYAFVQSRMN